MSEAILEEIRERFTYGTDEWAAIRKEAQKDMRYLTGDCWEQKDRKEREDAGRPCLSLDELSQYVNSCVNRERQHKRGIIVTAMGAGANDKTARFRQGLFRQIEYRSNAQSEAYMTMFQNTVERSYGFLRVTARYVSDKSFEQELIIDPFPNPDLVTLDPDGIRNDGADVKWAFVHESRSAREFLREWPHATKRDFAAAGRSAPLWFKKNGHVQIAEYWRVVTDERELLRLRPPAPTRENPRPGPMDVWADELQVPPTADQILMRRVVKVPRVEKYFTNGIELLAAEKGANDKALHWPGQSIPIVPCYGKIVWVEEGGRVVRKILSLIRLARDPQMLYCFYRTNEAELVGMTPKTPFVGYEGQFRDHEDEWATVNVEPKAYLEAKATVEGVGLGGGTPLPLPQRQPYDPPIQALEIGAESSRRAIQAALGISPLPTSAQRQNEKSGVALERIDSAQQTGSFHFGDHFNASLQRTGAILDELAPHYYDTAREVTIRKPDDTPENVRINDDTAPEAMHVEADHRHDVTISTGPSVDSERQAAEEFAALLANSPVAPQIMDLVVKLRNLGPIGDEIAERLTPPQYRKAPELKNLPPEAARLVQEAQGKIQELGQQLQQTVEALKTDQAKQSAMKWKAQLDASTRLQEQRLRNAAAIAVAKINALTKGVVAAQEAHDEAVALLEEQLHEAEQSELDRGHEQNLQLLGSAAALQKGDAETEQEALLADQAHGHALEAAAAAPAPLDDGGAPA